MSNTVADKAAPAVRKFDSRIVLAQYICSIIIVFIHSVNYDAWDFTREQFGGVWVFEKLIYHFCCVGVPTFFFFSGYLMFCRFSVKEYPKSVLKRVYSLLVPYFFWNLLFFALYYAMTHIPAIAGKMHMEPYPMELGFIVKGIVNARFAPLWYLATLFVMSVFSIVLYFLMKNRYIGIAVIFAVIAVNYFISYYSYIYWLPTFLIGAYWGMHIKDFGFRGKYKTPLLIASAVLFIAVFAVTFNSEDAFMLLLFRVTAVLTVPHWFGTFLNRDSQVKQPFKISLFIYCTHGVLVQIFQKLALLAFGKNPLNAAVSAVAVPLVTVAVITAVALPLKRYLNPLWRFFNGGRDV